MKDTRSDYKLNGIIANWRGWSFVAEHDVGFPTPAGIVYPEKWYAPEDETGVDYPPDYCKDLNAIHEVENKLDLQTKGRYADYLRIAVYYENQLPWVDAGSFAHINASARARAEALVIVIESQKV